MARRAWALVFGGYLAMAVGFIVFGFILNNHVQTIRATQKRALQTQQDLGKLAIHNSGAICLVATTDNPEKIVDAYLQGNRNITALFTPKCAEVARRAAHDVFDDHPPPGLKLH